MSRIWFRYQARVRRGVKVDVVTKPRVAAGIEGRRKELGSDLGIPSPSCPRSCHRASAADIGGLALVLLCLLLGEGMLRWVWGQGGAGMRGLVTAASLCLCPAGRWDCPIPTGICSSHRKSEGFFSPNPIS